MSANDAYEELAAQFSKDTGLMAPGKDVPAAVGADPIYNYEYRVQEWKKWLEKRSLHRKKEVTNAQILEL